MTMPQRRAAGMMAQTIAERISARPVRSAAPRRLGLQRFIAGWAAFGVTLSGATQLRMGGLPVGPSELILAAWILAMAFLLLKGVPFTAGRVFVGLVGYWLVALFLLGMGALIAINSHMMSSYAARDGLAFLYLSVLTPLLALSVRDQSLGEYHVCMARMFFLFNAVAAGLLVGSSAVTDSLGPINLFYGGIRFRGWAENPNQMALVMVAIPFLGWWLMRTSSSRLGKSAYALGIAACMVAGVVTQSDSLRVAWVASFGATGALLFYRVTLRGRSRWLYVSHAMIPALVLILGVFLARDIADYIINVADGVYAERDQGEERLTLWSHGIEVIRASPLVGFGPGAYSGLFRPFQNFEAHNSLIDWGMSTGLSGIALHLVLWGWCLQRALKATSVAPLGMLVSIMAVVMFGYLFRHPNYWIMLLFVLFLSDRRTDIAPRQAVAPALGGRSHPLPAGQTSLSEAPSQTRPR